MRFAGGRPLWHLSITLWGRSGKPVPVLRWGATHWRKAEAARDRIMRGVGTDEPYFQEDMTGMLGESAVSVHWRRPLRIDEVSQMAPTEEVRQRPGRA